MQRIRHMADVTTIEDRLDEIDQKIKEIVDALAFVMSSVGKTIKSPLVGVPDKTVSLAEGYVAYCRLRDQSMPHA